MRYILFFFFLFLLSCNKNETTTPQNTNKVTKITQLNSNYKDYSGRPQSLYEYDKSTGLFSLQTVSFYGYTEKTLYKPTYTNGHLVKLQLGKIISSTATPLYETISELTYDSKGRLIKNLSTEKRVEVFEYNTTDTKPVKVTITDNGKLFDVSQLKWVNENLMEVKHYGNNNTLSGTETYKYDTYPNFQQLISKEYYIHGSNSLASYFSKNNIIEEATTGIPFVKPVIKHKYTYNSQNLPVKILMEDYKDNLFYGIEIVY